MVERDWTLEVTAYIDGELSEADTRAFEARLAVDPALKALEQKLRRAVVAVEALPQAQVEASAALRRNVLAAIDAQPRPLLERVRAWLTPPRLVPVGLALAASVTAVVLWPGQQGVTPVDDPTDAEALLMAQHLDVVEDLDVAGIDSPDDLDVVASLHELEVK